MVSNFVVIPGTYYVEVLYVNGSISLMETYDITYDSGAKIYEKDADVSITKLNDNSIEISVSNYVESIVDFNILIYENDKLFTTLSTFHFVISNIDVNKKYEIKGYYTGKINDQLYIIYVNQLLWFWKKGYTIFVFCRKEVFFMFYVFEDKVRIIKMPHKRAKLSANGAGKNP